MTSMNAYQLARERGTRLDRVLPDSFQLRDGDKVLAVLWRDERGTVGWVNPAYDAGSSRIARDANGWQYVGRSSYLRGMVGRILEATR
jgi:hypothetical protein